MIITEMPRSRTELWVETRVIQKEDGLHSKSVTTEKFLAL